MSDKKDPHGRASPAGEPPSSSSTDTEQMPSVTRLLDRKKLKAGSGEKTSLTQTSLSRRVHSSGEEISRPSETDAPPSLSVAGANSRPQVKVASRQGDRRGVQRLEVLEAEVLRASDRSELRVLSALGPQGLLWALILTLDSPMAGNYRAAEVFGGTRERWGLWTGMSWSPTNFPEIWKEMHQQGAVRLLRDRQEHEGCLRVLGAGAHQESVWLFPVGDRATPRGLLFLAVAGTALNESTARQIVQHLSP